MDAVTAAEAGIVQAAVAVNGAIDDLHGAPLGTHRELSQEVGKVRSLLRDLDRQIDHLQSLADKARKPEERSQLSRLVANHRSAAEEAVGALRRESQRHLARLETEEREALLGEEEERGSAPVAGASMTEEAARTTATLSTLLGRMGDQVENSSASLTTLLASSSLLKETEDEFATMGNAISASGKLLCKWERREVTDKALFLLAILLFYATALYIVRKRLGALWIFSWI